jgi:hypothetical protein
MLGGGEGDCHQQPAIYRGANAGGLLGADRSQLYLVVFVSLSRDSAFYKDNKIKPFFQILLNIHRNPTISSDTL